MEKKPSRTQMVIAADGTGSIILNGTEVAGIARGHMFRGRPGHLSVLTLDTVVEEALVDAAAEVRIICPLCQVEMTRTECMTVAGRLRSCWTCNCPVEIDMPSAGLGVSQEE